MALEIKKTFSNGVEAKKCYARIGLCRYDSTKTVCWVEFFYDQESREKSLGYVSKESFEVLLPEVDPQYDNRVYLYDELKKLPEFKDAKDV